jgi:hypothetical protein
MFSTAKAVKRVPRNLNVYVGHMPKMMSLGMAIPRGTKWVFFFKKKKKKKKTFSGNLIKK